MNDADGHPYDDNRDNRMADQTRAPEPRHERGPSMIAYTVKDRGKDQDAVWRSVGAAFPHRDGKGMDVVLDAMPTDGRVTLREQRKQEFKEQRQGERENGVERQSPQRTQDKGPSR